MKLAGPSYHNYILPRLGVTLDLDQSLHSQGVLENESITLINSPQTNIGGLEAKTEGVTTRSEAKTNSQVSGSIVMGLPTLTKKVLMGGSSVTI